MTPDTFDITWRDGAYYVSIPNYQGGTVYTKEYVDGLLRQLAQSSERTVDDAMVERAMLRFQDAVNSMVACKRCNGTGYHHGYGEHGHDPDWCTVCGGCQSVPEFDDKAAMREALIAAVSSPVEGKT